MRHERIEQFMRFTSAKPRQESYEYFDTETCAIAQFYAAQGAYYPRMRHDTLLEDFAATEPHTFGSLTKRLKRSLNV